MQTIETSEPLDQVRRRRSSPTRYTPFWALESKVNAAIAEGRNISDYFGLPIGSEAPRYGMYRITPEVPTQIFINTVAPTSELAGLVTKGGGAEQVLIPNRKLFHEPVYIKSVENIPSITAEAGRSTLSSGMVRSVAILGAVAVAGDAYTTAQKYQALSAQGNEFGADTLLRRYEGRTAGGFVGSMAAGATYGFVAGSESGPGAFLTGAAGGVIGAFAGEKIARAINEHKVNHQTGTDGVTYAYEEWANGAALSITSIWVVREPPIPTTQPTTHRPRRLHPTSRFSTWNISACRRSPPCRSPIRPRRTRNTLSSTAPLGTPHARAGRSRWKCLAYPMPTASRHPITVDKPADARTSAELSQLAANRQFNNDHYASEVSNAYVMDYYGKGWSANGPLPDVVTKPLGLPSEQHIKDPGDREMSGMQRPMATSAGKTIASVGRVAIRETVHASGAELRSTGASAAVGGSLEQDLRQAADRAEV